MRADGALVFTAAGGNLVNGSSTRNAQNIFPTGQPAGSMLSFYTFQLWPPETRTVFSDPTGLRLVVAGRLLGSGSPFVATFNNAVVALQGVPLAGEPASDPVTRIDSVGMSPDGAQWYVVGASQSSGAWIIRGSDHLSFSFLARAGQTVRAGSGERWTTLADAAFNNRGDWVVSGATDHPVPAFRQVLVFNGAAVVARSGDPVDTDNDGVFDDGQAARGWPAPIGFLTEDGELYARIGHSSQEDVYCERSGGFTALARIALGPCRADSDGSGDVDLIDLFTFLSAWFVGNAAADMTGGASVTIEDIFAFLSLWFAGC